MIDGLLTFLTVIGSISLLGTAGIVFLLVGLTLYDWWAGRHPSVCRMSSREIWDELLGAGEVVDLDEYRRDRFDGGWAA